MSTDPACQECSWKSAKDPQWNVEKRLARFQLKNNREQRALLRKFGFHQSTAQRLGPLLVLTSTLGIAFSLVGWVLLDPKELSSPNGVDIATAVVAIGAFVFGYRQWLSARHEKAMEDFYSRLNLANHRRESVELVSSILGHPWDLEEIRESPLALCGYEDHQWSMYVYTELDNLEYVVEKYNLGYMQERHALRGLRTFYQRCLRQPFRDRAWQCVRCMAYNDSTIRVVERICQDIEERRKQPRPLKPLDTRAVLPWPLDKVALW